MWKNFFGTMGASRFCLGERRPVAGVLGAPALEVRAHVGNVEPRDLLAVDTADLAAVVGDQPHPQTFCAARA